MDTVRRARIRSVGSRIAAALVLTSLAAGLALVPAAAAAPPLNDNRADAAAIPAFPATIPGTTVEATVERLVASRR